MSLYLKHVCPSCGRSLKLRKQQLNKMIRCPNCQEAFEALDPRAASQQSIDESPSAVSVDTVTNYRVGTAADGQSSRSVDRTEQPLRTLGRFELKRILGQGAFGRVYLAFDPQLERDVAIKVLTTGANSAVRVQRFITEAKAAARLKHPNIVPTFESGKEDNRYYIASEFISGQLLSDDKLRTSLDERRSVKIIRKLAAALAYAHENRILHRDIKPQNIMVDDNGEPHLMDFGLARRLSEESNLTTDGALLGTPAYMSPEQARGEFSIVGPASDQYSLAVVLYQLLTGATPFDGLPHVVVTQVAKGDVPTARSVNPDASSDLSAVCEKAMQKLQSDRYASCKEFGDDLDAWLSGRPVAARPLNPLDRLIRAAATHQTITAMSCVTLVLVVVLAISVHHLLKTGNRMNDVAAASASERRESKDPKSENTTAVALVDTDEEGGSSVANSEVTNTATSDDKTQQNKAATTSETDEPKVAAVNPEVVPPAPVPEESPVSDPVDSPSTLKDTMPIETGDGKFASQNEIDLLKLVDPKECTITGQWTRTATGVQSAKQVCSKIQIPWAPQGEYDVRVRVTPLDPINGLAIGLVSEGHSFHVLLNWGQWNALEQVDGLDVGNRPGPGNNTSRVFTKELMTKDTPSLVLCRVRTTGVTVDVDGKRIIDWKGRPDQLSKNAYWSTSIEQALFVGSHDCRYGFSEITLIPMSAAGRKTPPPRILSDSSREMTAEYFDIPLQRVTTLSSKWSLSATDRIDGELALQMRPLSPKTFDTANISAIPEIGCPVILNLDGISLDTPRATDFQQIAALPRLLAVKWNGPKSHPTEMLTALTSNTSLRDLFLNSETLSQQDVQLLCQISKLKRLQLNDTGLTDVSVDLIAKSLPHLESLHMGYQKSTAGLSNSSIHSLTSLTKLKELSIRNCSSFDDKCVDDLSRLTSLQTLWADQTSITPAGYSKLRSKLPKTTIY